VRGALGGAARFRHRLSLPAAGAGSAPAHLAHRLDLNPLCATLVQHGYGSYAEVRALPLAEALRAAAYLERRFRTQEEAAKRR
jgi:hypothetical protein